MEQLEFRTKTNMSIPAYTLLFLIFLLSSGVYANTGENEKQVAVININVDSIIGKINPNIYGQMVDHKEHIAEEWQASTEDKQEKSLIPGHSAMPEHQRYDAHQQCYCTYY